MVVLVASKSDGTQGGTVAVALTFAVVMGSKVGLTIIGRNSNVHYRVLSDRAPEGAAKTDGARVGDVDLLRGDAVLNVFRAQDHREDELARLQLVRSERTESDSAAGESKHSDTVALAIE